MYKLANPAVNLIEVKWFYLYFISEWIAGQCDIWIHWRRHRSWSIVSCMKNGWFGHIFPDGELFLQNFDFLHCMFDRVFKEDKS